MDLAPERRLFMGLGLLLSAVFLGYPLIFMPSYISENTPFPKPLSKAEETRLLKILQEEKCIEERSDAGSSQMEMYRGGCTPAPAGIRPSDCSADAIKKDAKEKLINHNMRLVAHVAKKYSNTGIEQEDLISIGSVGLIKAIDSYSPQRSTRLGTYAARCIENAIHA